MANQKVIDTKGFEDLEKFILRRYMLLRRYYKAGLIQIPLVEYNNSEKLRFEVFDLLCEGKVDVSKYVDGFKWCKWTLQVQKGIGVGRKDLVVISLLEDMA